VGFGSPPFFFTLGGALGVVNIRRNTASRRPASGSEVMDSKFREVEMFGADVLLALGVIAIRAAQMELYLVTFLSTVSGIPYHKANAVLYSSQNAKARLDMLRALVNTAKYSDETKRYALKLLDRVKELSDQRNMYLHWQYVPTLMAGTNDSYTSLWSSTPASAKPNQVRRLDIKAVESTANEHVTLRQKILRFCNDLAAPDEPASSPDTLG
jgi:hypothetical protein